MLKIHILSPGFASANARALVFPIIVYRKTLLENGISCFLFNKSVKQLFHCDVLIIDSKYHRHQWPNHPNAVLGEFELYKKLIDRVLYFDTSDSSTWINPEVLPIVDLYCKSYLMKDKNHYMNKYYGNRIYTDYYHNEYGVSDDLPEFSNIIENKDFLKKLRLSWNSGLSDYSLNGPRKIRLYKSLGLKALIQYTTSFEPPSLDRDINIQCRMGVQYRKNTVAFQRGKIKSILSHFLTTNKLSRRSYFKELKMSKIVISPFGWGEITLKDFEVFLTGGLLMKPCMDHLITWPDLYKKNDTYIPFSWNCTDLEDKISEILGNYKKYISIALSGQNNYRKYIYHPDQANLFIEHFKAIIDSSWN
jgi:hypothetical protein